jgi:hypothetical protein
MLDLADGSVVVTPNTWVMAGVLVFLVGGLVTAAKGRWGWLLVGCLVGGALWPLTALLEAAPESIWERVLSRFSGRDARRPVS